MAKERKQSGQGVGGGPKTRDGKQRSSGNSTTHGLRSNVLIMPDEKQSDFDEVQRGWREEFEPEGFAENTMVDALILNDWLRRRSIRRMLEAEAAALEACGTDPHEWSSEHRQTTELMQRYNTTRERAFYRSWNAVQGLRKDILRFRQMELQAKEKLARVEGELATERRKRQELEALPGVKEIRKELNRRAPKPTPRLFRGEMRRRKQGKAAVREQIPFPFSLDTDLYFGNYGIMEPARRFVGETRGDYKRPVTIPELTRLSDTDSTPTDAALTELKRQAQDGCVLCSLDSY